ncbi:hypothetical protein CCHR01_19238 [Colletotrichum chrysophilum]|uniref:Myb/SANT-like domain-containing protein n=1 Tax=Colletotrichum chrysophilum TaxID=1836956 RepID=A0AAD9E7D8_9PEZI|nr:hypothetical protein CCHR01_19238 [Colletotrichum chrysophilum]
MDVQVWSSELWTNTEVDGDGDGIHNAAGDVDAGMPPPPPFRRRAPGSSQQGPSSSSSRVAWSREALRLFLILVQEQVNEGVFPNNRGSNLNRAMGNILPQMQAEFPEPPGYTLKTLANKYKSLSCDWRKVKCLLRSDVEYDNDSGMIYTSEDCWQDLIAKNPYLRAIREKGFPFIDEMRVLWPDEVSTGQYIVEASGANAIEITSNDEDEADEVGVAIGEPSRRQKRKRSNRTDPDENPIASDTAPDVASSAEPVRRCLTRQGEERSHQSDKFGGRIERGISRLGEAISSPRETESRRGNLSYFLGGKRASDPEDWSPCVDVVNETIKFAMSTERLDAQISQQRNHTPPTLTH